LKNVTGVKVYERTGDAVISYVGIREEILDALIRFQYDSVQVPAGVIEHSGRGLNARYQEKLVGRVIIRAVRKLFIPGPLRAVHIGFQSVKYIVRGFKSLLRGKLEVAVLDAVAIGVSALRGELETAGSVMFLLGIGELLEEWTHKKSVGDLARSMSLNVSRVWLLSGGQEVLVEASSIVPGDEVVVHMGNVIPFDGAVISGEGMVNQASLTGEALPVKKEADGYV